MLACWPWREDERQDFYRCCGDCRCVGHCMSAASRLLPGLASATAPHGPVGRSQIVGAFAFILTKQHFYAIIPGRKFCETQQFGALDVQ